jgi:hypothetical protein
MKFSYFFSVGCCVLLFFGCDARKNNADKVLQLSTSKIDELQDALFGGKVWVISCKKKGEDLTGFLTEAAKLFSKDVRCDGECFVATLDCTGKLPSGRSVLKRFDIRPQKGIPTLILTLNGKKPVRLKPTHFTQKMKGKKNKGMVELAAPVLVKYVSRLSLPKLHKLKKPNDFESFCTRRRLCVALAVGRNGKGPSKMQLAHKKVIQKMVRKYRSISFIQVDTSKWQLTVRENNVQSVLDADSGESSSSIPSIVAFKKAKYDATGGKGYFRHLNGKPGTSSIAMSLCRHLIFKNTSAATARKLFRQHRVNITSFNEKPVSILQNPQALFRINKVYYTWKAAASYIASQALFDKPLPFSTMSKIANHTEKTEKREAKKRGSELSVITTKMFNEGGSLTSLSSTMLQKFLESVIHDDDDVDSGFVRNVEAPTVKRFLSEAEKDSLEEEKKRKKMQRLQSRRKEKENDAKRAEKKKERLKKRRRRMNRRSSAGKEEMEKDRIQREQRRRAEMDREMQEVVMAADDEDEGEEVEVDYDAGIHEVDTQDGSLSDVDDDMENDEIEDGPFIIEDDDKFEVSADNDEEVIDLGDLDDDDSDV